MLSSPGRVSSTGRTPSNFVPPMMGNCALWWRADLGITLNSTTVSSWVDQVAGIAMTQATAGLQPTYNASDAAANGLPTVGVSSTANSGLFTLNTVVVPQPDTVYVVGRQVQGTGGDIFDGISNTPATNRQSIGNNTSGFYFYAGTVAGNIVNFGPNKSVDSGVHMFGVAFNGASTTGYVDTVTTGYVGNAGTNSLVGPSVAGAFPNAVGAVAEIVVFNGLHSAAQVRTMFRYFAYRYGLQAP
jgi:hypothetical protein